MSDATALRYVDRIRAFAFDRNVAVVALHPSDFQGAAADLAAKIEYGEHPTPQSMGEPDHVRARKP